MNYSKTLVLGWLFVVMGCSGTDEGSSTPVPLEQFPQQYSAALCESIAPCCKDAALPNTPATCKSNATQRFTTLATQGNSASIRYDAAAAGQCLSQIKSAFASCQSPTEVTAAACDRIFVGTLATGATCSPNLNECANGYCKQATDASLGSGGTCTPYETNGNVVGEGQSCDDIRTYCAENFFCGYESSAADTGVCIKLAPLGADCSQLGCQKGAFCSATAVCTAQYDSGPCGGTDSYDACSSNSYCSDDGGVVSSSAGQCLKKKPEGYACQRAEECQKGVCNGTCGPATAASTANCAGEFTLPRDNAYYPQPF